MWLWSLGWEDPLKEDWQPAPVFLPGKSHGQRSLTGYSSKGCEESDAAEHACTCTVWGLILPIGVQFLYKDFLLWLHFISAGNSSFWREWSQFTIASLYSKVQWMGKKKKCLVLGPHKDMWKGAYSSDFEFFTHYLHSQGRAFFIYGLSQPLM